MWNSGAKQAPKSRILEGFWRIVNVATFIREYTNVKNIHRLMRCMRRNDMISFKRTKRRNYQQPGEKYALFGVAGMFVLLLVIMLVTASGKNRLENQLVEARESMAASIQSDMNRVLKAYGTIDHKSADLADEVLPTMKQHMYSANSMNDILKETFGDEYSMFDQDQYDAFLSIMDQFDQLLATGQSTSSAKANLVPCMESLKVTLANRFTADGGLLPRTAMKSSQP